jgi:hypothetical protein
VARVFDRYVEALGRRGRTGLIEFGGRGAMRQEVVGRSGFWFPIVWEAYLVPGSEFVWVAQVRALGLPFSRAGDEFKDGKGRARIGRRVFDGDGYDRAEYTLLWAWTLLLAPQEAQARPDVVIEPAGSDAARVSFPFRTETWGCTLRFAPEDGLLRVIETHRFDPRSGQARRWSAEVERWSSAGELPHPETVLARWEDRPAVRIEIDRVSMEGV